jgi:hypothetical protein
MHKEVNPGPLTDARTWGTQSGHGEEVKLIAQRFDALLDIGVRLGHFRAEHSSRSLFPALGTRTPLETVARGHDQAGDGQSVPAARRSPVSRSRAEVTAAWPPADGSPQWRTGRSLGFEPRVLRMRCALEVLRRSQRRIVTVQEAKRIPTM